MNTKILGLPISSLQPSKPKCVSPGGSVEEVIRIMRENKFGCVCVADNLELVGIVTERDILTKVVGAGLSATKTLVSEIMTPQPEYLFADDQVAYALNRMHVGGFRHIPLVDLKGKPTGVISVRDIVKHLIKQIEKSDA
ncbi:MAG: cyclic nucleotide-binding/CBS domain-containing protein [bacterium]